MPTLRHKRSIFAFVRLGCLLFVAALGVAGSGVSAVAASKGCDAVNGGGLNTSVKVPKNVTNEFNADTLVLTLAKPGPGSLNISLSSSLVGSTSKGNASNGDTLTLILNAGKQTVTSSMTGTAEGFLSISVICIPGPALASTSIQSSLNPSQLGDAVTFTATVKPASGEGTPTGTVTFTVDDADVATVPLSAGSAHFITSTLTAGTHPIRATYNGGSGFDASASPVLSQAVGTGAADSERLREMQIMATKLAAQTSGQSMQGAIDTAIDDGFDENGNPVTAGDNSLQFNFAAEPKAIAAKPQAQPLDPLAFDQRAAGRSSAESASDAIDSSLGQSSQYGMATADGDAVGKRWRPWVNIRGTHWNAGSDEADVEGNQVNALAGVTYKISPRFLVGVFAGYEDFSYSSAPLDATLDGNGWTAGAYLGWRVAPALRFDAGIARSAIDYSDTAGRASGEFDGERWFFTSGLTGTHKMGAFIIEPSAKIYALWESEDAYTDSLGTLQPERDFSTGRASGGFKLAYPVAIENGGKFVPFAGIYGDYYFSDDDAAATLTFDDLVDDGWSARFTGGFSFTMPSGVSASLSGEVGGLGSGAQNVSGRASLSVPF